MPWTRLSVTVSEEFDAEPPITVPLSIEAAVSNVRSGDVALRGVEVTCSDTRRDLLASERLGDFAWHDAPPERREREEQDTGWGSTTTVYRADWELETTIEVDEVPEWIGFSLEGVWFGDDESDGTTNERAVVGTARASSPPPELTATAGQYERDRPPASSVKPEAYNWREIRDHSRNLGSYFDANDPILPDPSARTGEVDEIEIELEETTITDNETTPVHVTATYVDNTTGDVTGRATIATENDSVAVGSWNGIEGVDAGQVSVEATYGNETAATTMNVTPEEPDRREESADGR